MVKKLFIMYFLGEQPSVGESHSGEHVTILGNLIHPTETKHEQLIQSLEQVTKHHPLLVPDMVRKYGAEGQYTALELKDITGELKELHRELYSEAQRHGYSTTHPQYANENYSPHITLTEDTHSHTLIKVQHLTLMETTLTMDNRFQSSTALHTQPIQLPPR